MILAPLTELPKEERDAFVAKHGGHYNQSDCLAAINAHRAKLDKVVSEFADTMNYLDDCICEPCKFIRRLKELDTPKEDQSHA